MNQQLITGNKQALRKQTTPALTKPVMPVQKQEDRALQIQNIIGNHGFLRLGGSDVIQAKLIIGHAGDVYEKEADMMAERVLRMPEPFAAESVPDKSQEGFLQKKESAAGSSHSGNLQGIPSVVHEVLQSPGEPLDLQTRAFFEPRFGHDFSQVRIHTDNQASMAAAMVNSKAFTVGSEVVFGQGHYSPGSCDFNKLIAHELTHVIQNNVNEVRRVAVNVINDIDTEKTTATDAANAAEQLANKAQMNIGVTDRSLYENWFDFNYDPKNAPSVRRFWKVKTGWDRINDIFKNRKIILDCSVRDETIYAEVNKADWRSGIGLCKQFWEADITGIDSQGGTLIHEISHLGLNTNDNEYGESPCLLLARTNPDKAVENADSWEYFAEFSL